MTPRKKPEDKQKPGRKSAFKDEYVELAYNYSLLGATDKEMAGFFDVSERTFNSWKKAHPVFLQSIKRGKVQADAEVASKLHSRALGFNFDEIHVEKKGRKIASKKTITKHIPPDVNAGKFWLSNRQPDKWRNKQAIEVDVPVRGSVAVGDWIEHNKWLKVHAKPKKED